MSFDQSTIQDVVTGRREADIALSWTSTAAAGTWFQVYLNRVLTWHGTDRACVLPYPAGYCRIDVGTVLPSEASLDLSASLPAPPGGGNRVQVAWQGGAFESPNLAGFYVYMSAVAGGPIVYTAPVATIPAYTGSVTTDGWGMGTFGSGGFGSAAGNYSWTSGIVRAGVWSVAVVPFDTAGNSGTGTTGSVTVSGPPLPPARNAAGQRLTYTYNATTHVPTLNWLASPGA